MLTNIESMRTQRATRPARTVAVIGSPKHGVFDSLQRGPDHDVVLIESLAHAYSRIKHVAPDLIVVCLSDDDVDGCRVLSMLALDADTSRIPVVTS